MDFFSILTMLGGLALFLYGMNAMGDGLAKVSGGKAGAYSGKTDLKSHQGGTSRMWSYGSDPVVLRNDSYGRRICQFRNYEVRAGSRSHHGSEYRYDRYLLVLSLTG